MNKFGMLSIRIPKTLSGHSEINSLGWLHEILRQRRMYKYSPLKTTMSPENQRLEEVFFLLN